MPWLLYGVILILLAFAFFTLAGLFSVLALAVFGRAAFASLAFVALVAGSPAVVAGVVLSAVDLFVLLPLKRHERLVHFDQVANPALTVVLTAFNDEASIGQSVQDFLSHPLVRRVVVVDNSSSDKTGELARVAGAEVVVEKEAGYGRCVHRALSEGLAQTDTELTLLCEGDMTFRAFDIDKFMAYIPHADIVNGTRIVEQLRSRDTQLTTFMYYGNFFVGKLLEAKHIGKGTFTDVGTTYKLCRNSALEHLLPHLDSSVNLEFNAYFLDTALELGLPLVECPVTFHQRVGPSKGGNASNTRALRVGFRMMRGIVFSWQSGSRQGESGEKPCLDTSATGLLR